MAENTPPPFSTLNVANPTQRPASLFGSANVAASPLGASFTTPASSNMTTATSRPFNAIFPPTNTTGSTAPATPQPSSNPPFAASTAPYQASRPVSQFNWGSAPDPLAGKLTRFISSPLVAVHVGSGLRKQVYNVHAALLKHVSERFAASLGSGFREAKEHKIELPDEHPELFRCFVAYAYQGDSVVAMPSQNASEIVNLARLYVLGDRLLADSFKSTVLKNFLTTFSHFMYIPNGNIFEMLEIACEDLPERTPEDPMRAFIFWYGASKMTLLRTDPGFMLLLRKYPDLAIELCMRAGDGKDPKPAVQAPAAANQQPPLPHDPQVRWIDELRGWSAKGAGELGNTSQTAPART